MAIAVRQVSSAVTGWPGYGSASTSITLSLPSAVLAGSAIIACTCGGGASSVPTISASDSVNGSWTLTAIDGGQTTNPSPVVAGNYFLNSAAGSPTVTLSSNAGSYNCYGFSALLEVTGLLTSSALDAHPTVAAGPGTTPASNSTGTLAQAVELAIALAAMNTGNNTTFAGLSGWTNVAQVNTASTYEDFVGSIDYQVLNATTSISANYGSVVSSSSAWACGIFTLKGATASVVQRKTLSTIGGRVGSRQAGFIRL